MKSLSDLLHQVPWWALLAAGVALFVALAVFSTPFNLLSLDQSGATPEENRAIKREIDVAFSEGAIDVVRGVIKKMREHTHDRSRQEELDRALAEIDQAREGVREADEAALSAKREAAQAVTGAVKEAAAAIKEAQKETARALKDAGIEREKITKSLEDSLKAAQQAQEEARRAAGEATGKPHAAIVPQAKGVPQLADLGQPGPGNTPLLTALPPEVRAHIHEKVTGDLYRIGLGAGLILLFIPLFILTVVAKVFIDRSRASQRLADLKRKEAEYHRMSQQVTEAKLSALQAQVEPHFLYNTLASVQALTEVDPKQANAMTGHLIQYLRNALPKMRESGSTVGQEIELVRAYLNILQIRMGKRLAFEINVPPELMAAAFPPLILPSLVENAIKHGLEAQREGGKVTISAQTVAGRLRLRVADTGRGFAETLGSGLGLSNIRERLSALYGEAGKLTLENNPPQGVVAIVELPRDGARPGAPATSATVAASSTAPPSRAQGAATRALAAMGSAERAWRKGLSFAFVVLVVLAAVAAGLALMAVASGALPVDLGNGTLDSATGTLVGAIGIAAAFFVVVLAIAAVLAIVYGLGFLFMAIALFVVLAILVSLFPVLAPFLLLGLLIWWLVRRSRPRAAGEKTP